MPGVKIDWMSTDEYEKAGDDKLIEGGRCKYDLVIFDNHDTAKLPLGSYLFFGGVPKIAGVSAEGEIEKEHVVNWDESHPLMRYVHFEKIYIDKWRKLKLPSGAVPLVEGEQSTIVAYLTDPGRQFVVTAFDLLDSNAPFEIAFVMFMQNAVRTLTAAGGDVAHMVRPGDTIACPVPRGATQARV